MSSPKTHKHTNISPKTYKIKHYSYTCCETIKKNKEMINTKFRGVSPPST